LLAPGANGPAGARLGEAVERAAPLLASASEHLGRAATLRGGIDRAALQGRLGQLGVGLDQVDRVVPTAAEQVGELAAVAPALPDLLGMQGPRAYLVLGQNERETRATGGFLGSMGRLVIDRGAIAESTFQSSYAFDNPGREAVRPPQELARFMDAGAWYVRDANWWADFRTSAAQVERFWEADQGSPVDGVIAVDEAAVATLIDAVGPIDVPELGRAVRGQEFFTLARE